MSTSNFNSNGSTIETSPKIGTLVPAHWYVKKENRVFSHIIVKILPHCYVLGQPDGVLSLHSEVKISTPNFY